MKYTLQIAFAATLLFFTSCTEDQETETFTNDQWRLLCIDDGTRLKVKYEDINNEDAFVLKTDQDSFYSLQSDVNSAGGLFKMYENRKIEIDYYQEFTQAYSSDKQAREVVAKLTEILPEVTEYQVKGNHLYMTGTDLKIKFEKRWPALTSNHSI